MKGVRYASGAAPVLTEGYMAHRIHRHSYRYLILAVFMILLASFCWHSPTQAAAARTSVYPQKDKYVDSAGGVNNSFIIVAGKYTNGSCEGILGFDISQVSGPVTSATLNINVSYSFEVNNPPLYLRTNMNIYGSNSDSWSEDDASIPSKDAEILSSQCVDRAQSYSYDVTSFLQTQTDGYATFVLEPEVTDVYRYFYFHSSDGAFPCDASLVINYLDPAATLSGSGLNETNINGSTVNIALEDTTFGDSALDSANFTLTGGIDGLSISSVNYMDDTHCALTLAYDGADFDHDFSFGVSIGSAELTTWNDLEANNTLSVAAVNDAESLSLAYDGSITEGAEDGEVITVTLSGGQFADTINPNNWTLGNLPAGVSKGSVLRIDDHTVAITLSGNATYDYDVDITDMRVTCTTAEYRDSTGGESLTCSTGVRFTADNNRETLTLSDSGDITEDHEDRKTFLATLSGGQFAPTLHASNWSISGQPSGVSILQVDRLDDFHARITLYGLTSVDYDADLHPSVSCSGAEYMDSTGDGTLTGTGITFHANNDSEVFYIQTYNSQRIYEGQENGKVIWALLSGGKWPWIVDPADWSFSGLPDGVTIGSVSKDHYYTPGVNIILSGNATQDYDSDKTLSVTCSTDGYSDSTGNGPLTSANVRFTAINDPESISISDDGAIHEGAEDGEIITVRLTGGTFPETLDPANWTVANLPRGVIKQSVTRIDLHTVEIALSGNAQEDYDTDITNVSVTCGVSEYNDHTGGGPLTCSTGVRLLADNDTESLCINDDGWIGEGAEDGEVITATLYGGILSNPITPANWTITGLPAGVTKGAVIRLDNHHVAIRLSGDANVDYDSDISNVAVTCTSDEYSGTLRTDLGASGIVFHAIDDAESISLSNAGVITEGSEDGEIIAVTLTGGRFANTLNSANWTLTGLPAGVTKGTLTRIDDRHVSISLSGNASCDYDRDITDISVTCAAEEYMDHTGGGPLTCATGVTLQATDDAEQLFIADDGLITEGAEDGEVITATLTGGVFSQAIHSSNWSIDGQPEGVSIATVTRLDDHTVSIGLSGTATEDYDADITAMRVTCSPEEYLDHDGDGALTSNPGVRFTAINDGESITIRDDGQITEGAEDGEIITVTLTGGLFSNPVNADHWTVTGLPSGVTKGAVTRIASHTVTIQLSGNTDIDYDEDITGVTVSCTSQEYSGTSNTVLTADTGVTLQAVYDLESLQAGAVITEGAEDGSVITVTINGGSFPGVISPENWTVGGLPEGVEKGTVERLDSRTVAIRLTGNAAYDYDSDISLSVTCAPSEYIGTLRIPLTASGIVLKAIDDPETLTLSDDGIREGAEDGKTITVRISGGQFVRRIDPRHWKVDHLPAGVSVGSVTRFDAHTVIITLSGNAAEDYDEDITNVKVTCEGDQYDSGNTALSAQGGIVFSAVVEATAATGSALIAPAPSATQAPDAGATAKIRTLEPTFLQENKNTGTISIEFNRVALPSGTASIRLANGTQMNSEGASGKVRLKISDKDLNENGELILTALDDSGIPLATFSIRVLDQNGQLLPTGFHAALFLWALAGISGLGAAAGVGGIAWKKRNRR